MAKSKKNNNDCINNVGELKKYLNTFSDNTALSKALVRLVKPKSCGFLIEITNCKLPVINSDEIEDTVESILKDAMKGGLFPQCKYVIYSCEIEDCESNDKDYEQT